MIFNFLKTTIRTFLRQKLYSTIILAGLSLGMASVLVIYTFIRSELSRGDYHRNADRLYRVIWSAENDTFQGYHQPGKLSAYLKANYPEVQDASNYLRWQAKLSAEIEGVVRMGAYVDPQFLEMFMLPLLYGDPASALDNPTSIIVSEDLALSLFGRTDVMGETLKFSDSTELQITGVMANAKHYPELEGDYLVPWAIAPTWADQWGAKCCYSYVMLDDQATWQETSEKIAGVMNQHNPDWKNTLELLPFKHNYLHSLSGWSSMTYYTCFAAMAGFVLLIGCVNFINLSFARMEKRGREIGIRKVVGSSRFQIGVQFLGESFFYTLCSLLLAVLLVEAMLPVINSRLGMDLSFVYSSGSVFMMLLLVMVTGVIAGGYPTFCVSGYNPVSIFKPTGKGRKGVLFRRGLIVFQFTLSVFLLICLFLIRDQVNYLRSKDLGFEKENLVLINLNGSLVEKRHALKTAIESIPAVKHATVSANNLQFWGNSGPLSIDGQSPDLRVEFGYNWVDDDFADTLQVEMKQGRFFSPEYSTDTTEAFVINEAAYTLLQNNGLEEPLGAEVTTWMGNKGRIIGVMKDYHTTSLHQAIMPFFLLHAEHAYFFNAFFLVRLNPGDHASAIEALRKAVKSVVPDDPCSIRFFDDDIQQAYQSEGMTYQLTASGAILALIISSLGLFGLTALTVEQRRKEIGVRKVVGATTQSVFLLFVTDSMRWVIVANLIAWPLAWYAMHWWLQEFSFRIEIGLLSFVFASLLTLFAALFAVAYQTYRTAESNPIESLRYE
jgi:putative ABC transport system permease protein